MIETQVLPSFYELDFSAFRLPMIVIYDHPIDCSTKFVARVFDVEKITKYAIVADSLVEIRENIPPHFVKFERQENDDADIVEIWV
jgi:hypothetical protein